MTAYCLQEAVLLLHAPSMAVKNVQRAPSTVDLMCQLTPRQEENDAKVAASFAISEVTDLDSVSIH